MVEKILFGNFIPDCPSSANRDRHLEEELSEGVADVEGATDLPKCELIGFDIGQRI